MRLTKVALHSPNRKLKQDKIGGARNIHCQTVMHARSWLDSLNCRDHSGTVLKCTVQALWRYELR